MVSAAPMPSTVAHLDALATVAADTGGYLVTSTLVPGGKLRSASFAVDEVSEAAQHCRNADDHGANVYVRTNLIGRRVAPHERGTHADTLAAVAFTVDLDVAGPGHRQAQTELQLPPSLDAAMSIVADLPSPSLTIHTGGGAHLWWLLAEASTDQPVALLNAWADRIVEAGRRRGYLVDRPDASRVLRVAGTHRRKSGLPPNRVTLADVEGWPTEGLAKRPWCPAGRYAAEDLLAALPAPQPAQKPALPAAPRPQRRPGEVGPADAVARLSWAQIFEGTGWTFVGMSTVDGSPVELWQRPGGTSPYSAKCFPDGPAIAWSDACGLPVGRGQRLNKWRVAVHLHYRGDEQAAARDIRRGAREAA